VIPGDEHNVLDPPTEVIAHLPHPIHNLVWFAVRKVREGSQAPHDTCRDWRRPIERIKTLRLHPVESESFDFRPESCDLIRLPRCQSTHVALGRRAIALSRACWLAWAS